MPLHSRSGRFFAPSLIAHLSGVRRTTYKGIRVVVFKYRFDYLVPC